MFDSADDPTRDAEAALRDICREAGAANAFYAETLPMVVRVFKDVPVEQRDRLLAMTYRAAMRSTELERCRQRSQLALQLVQRNLDRTADSILQLDQLREVAEQNRALAFGALAWSHALEA